MCRNAITGVMKESSSVQDYPVCSSLSLCDICQLLEYSKNENVKHPLWMKHTILNIIFKENIKLQSKVFYGYSSQDVKLFTYL